MLSACDRVAEMPDDTKVFCGHEYSAKNLEFGKMAEPGNIKIEESYQKFVEMNKNGWYTVPGLVG